MADIQGRVSGKFIRRYKDMQDGTHAEVISSQIGRDRDTVTVTIAAGAALSDAMDFRYMGGAILHMPAAWTAADIGFYVSPTGVAGSFQPLYDELNALVQIDGATADRSYALPAAIFAAHYVQLWSQNAGVSENQAAARELQLSLKA